MDGWHQMIKLRVIALMGLLSTASAMAEVVQITAKFAPDPSGPHVNVFQNTTPNSGYCGIYPQACNSPSYKKFSVGTNIEFNSVRSIPAKHINPRDGATLKVPASWKTVPVKDELGRDAGAVTRRPLLLSGSGTERFEPTLYVDRKPGTLHFEITKEGVSQMLKFPGHRYSGEVTVIWDSEV